MAPHKRKESNTPIMANSRRKRVKVGSSESGPMRPARWIPTFSRATLYNFEDERTHQNMYHDLNQQNPGSHETWGTTRTGALSSIKKKGKCPRIQNYFTGLESFASLFQGSSGQDPAIDIPNGPHTSRLLGLPLEVREKIYGFLNSDPNPVAVGHDWETVQGRVLRYSNIQYVCKQLADEASKFLYTHNVFQAILRHTRIATSVEKVQLIDHKFLSLYRNVVMVCPIDNWNMDWHETAASSVQKLADANAFLTSLTFVVCPFRSTGTSTTALGLETNPLHFADFFYFGGPLMTSIRKLRCKVLNIIVKKRIVKPYPGQAFGFTSYITRFLISVYMTCLQARTLEHSPLANAETIAITRENVAALEHELQGLKDRLEVTYEQSDKALSEGLCRELDKEEDIIDGMALAKRKKPVGNTVSPGVTSLPN